MELRLHHIIHLYNIFRENDGKENCAQFIEEEFNRMFGINDEHECNVVSMNSLNIRDANMQSHKLGMLCLVNVIVLVPRDLMCKFFL